MAGIGIITNPHAKSNKRNPERPKLLSYIAGSRGTLETSNTIEELESIAAQFARKDIDTLAINGGDGTISSTLTAFIHEYGKNNKPLPDIALLRGGTMNVLADNLNIHGPPEQILYRLMQGHSLRKYMGTIELNTLKIDNHYGFLFANASALRFLEEFYKRKKSYWGSLLFFGRVLLSYLFGGRLFKHIVQETTYELEADDNKPIQMTSPVTFCSTVELFPLKIKVFPLALKDPDHFQFLGILSEAQKLPKILHKFIFNLQGAKSHKVEFACRSLKLKTQTVEDNAYTLDGEIFYPKSNHLKISLGPKVRFILV